MDKRRRTTTNREFDDLSRRCNLLRAMVKSLVVMHEHPESMIDPSTDGRARLLASAKRLLGEEPS